MASIIAIIVIGTYRLIPCRIRRLWSFGTSTSHLAMAAAINGEGFRAFRFARFGTHYHDDPGWLG